MGDPHTRSMEGSWNPGEVWPVPVECLLNGMPGDAHLMFGGGPVFSPHFRHRFQPAVHLSSAHLAPLPGSINVNVSIPMGQHSLVETGQVGESGNPTVSVQDGQDTHTLSQPLSMDNGDGLDESDDASEEDDEDEVNDGVPMVHGHEQQHTHNGPIAMTHGVETDSLVHCQQVVRNPLHQPTLLQIDGSEIQQCLQQQKQDDVVRHSHPGHNHPVDSMVMTMDSDFGNQNSSDGDPNSGFSVHGKMYFEGRVVLHLKQWTDSPASDGSSVGMGNGFSYPDQQHQKSFHGCAVCRLKSPHENHRNQKEAHRHTVKGVLFTFEDCIIVELYPEPPPSCSNATVEPKQPPMPDSQQPKNHPMPIESYMNSSVNIPSQPEQPQEHVKKFIHHLDVNCLGNPDPANPKQPVTLSHPQTADDQSWWDEFESSDDLKRAGMEEEPDSNNDPPDSSCISSLKLRNQVQSDDDSCQVKRKCNSPCPPSYLTAAEIQSHACQNPSVVSLDDVHLTSGPHSIQLSTNGDNDAPTLQPSEESHHSITTATSPQTESEHSSIATDLNISKPNTLLFSCLVCNKSFHLKRLLKQHLDETHSDGNPLRCLTCNQQFTDQKRLKKHTCIRKVNKKSGNKSSGKKSPTKPKLIFRNEGDDINEKEFSDEDEDSEKSKQGIEIVEVRSNGDLKFSPEDSSSSVEVNNINLVSKDKGDSSKRSMKIKSTKKASKPYKCEVCGKGFTVERRLENHKLSHNSERSSQCEKCGKRFARKDKLMRHMYVHSEEKLFSCDICLKRFSRRDKLADHLKSHGGADEIHNCPMCQKQFLRPDILKQHVKLHTMGNKHQCSECLRFVTGKDRLEKHMARHIEAKALGQTLLCPLCTKYFIQKQSLKAHIKKFHPNSNINIDSQDSEQDQQQILGLATTKDSDPLNVELNLSPEEITNCKPFKCSHCPRVFTKRQAFKKHLRKHNTSPLTSPSDSLTSSPNPQEEESPQLSSSSSDTPDLLLANSSPPTNQIILSAPHPTAPSENSNGTNSSSLNLTSSGIAIIQQNLNPSQCSHLQHASHSHAQHTNLLTHGVSHPMHGVQVPPMAHPTTGQIHTNLSQHVPGPTIQHHVSMATQQTMCGSSYVLTYPHYSYQ